jgi:TolB-like protein
VPFANLTGEPAKEYFSDGMAEELINVLSKVPGLEVASRTSSFAYKGKNSDIRQIARDLDVATILEGSVRSAGARIRVTAELVNAGSGYHIWSESYDRNYGDLFKLEDELAGEIVAAFKKSQGVDLPAYESQGPPTADLEAYRLYLQGKAAFSLDTDPGAHEAIELTEQAVARDPKFARAWILMADARDYLSSSPLAEIERDARQAIALDPSAGDGGLLGLVESRRGHWVAAEEQFRGRTANSKDPWLHARYAFATLWPGGHIQSMLQQLLQAYHLSPATATFSGDLQVAFANMDRDAEALRYAKINVAAGADPSNAKIKQTYIDDLVQARRYSEAADMAIALLSEDQRARGTAEQIKLYYAAVEDPAKRPAAVSALKHLVPGFGHDDWRSRVGAMIQFTILGDLDSAYGLGDQLRALFAKQGPLAAWSWLWSPPMHPFRADQRFQGFATRLGLMDYWNKYGPPDDCNLKEHKLTCH